MPIKTKGEMQSQMFVRSPKFTYSLPHFTMIRTLTRLNIRRYLATQAFQSSNPPPIKRRDWTREEIQAIFDSPLMDLVFRAAVVHRQFHDPSKIQLCTLINIKSMFPEGVCQFFDLNLSGSGWVL